MPAAALKTFLDLHGIRYVRIQHSLAYTAPEVAASVHVSGRDFAKTLIVRIGGELAMVVVPAHRHLLVEELGELLERDDVTLASETDFRDRFPDCELGAMPPFGHLYGMKTYVSSDLADERRIAFNAGTHTEVITMAYVDYEQVVQPVVVDFVTA